MAGESFSPYDLATQGQNSRSPFTLSIQGQLSPDIIIEEIEVPTIPVGEVGFGRYGKIPTKQIEKKKIKKITVKCIIDGKEYIDSAYCKDLKITAKDIKVNIQENKGIPKIIVEVVGK